MRSFHGDGSVRKWSIFGSGGEAMMSKGLDLQVRELEARRSRLGDFMVVMEECCFGMVVLP